MHDRNYFDLDGEYAYREPSIDTAKTFQDLDKAFVTETVSMTKEYENKMLRAETYADNMLAKVLHWEEQRYLINRR